MPLRYLIIYLEGGCFESIISTYLLGGSEKCLETSHNLWTAPDTHSYHSVTTVQSPFSHHLVTIQSQFIHRSTIQSPFRHYSDTIQIPLRHRSVTIQSPLGHSVTRKVISVTRKIEEVARKIENGQMCRQKKKKSGAPSQELRSIEPGVFSSIVGAN